MKICQPGDVLICVDRNGVGVAQDWCSLGSGTSSHVSPSTTGCTTLYRSGMTNVVLQVLFMQQNQRVKKWWRSCFSATPSYSLICIGLPQRGQGSPSPGMTINFFRFRFSLNTPPLPFT
jgi:hypothetical protein